jgi:hypothetical protein
MLRVLRVVQLAVLLAMVVYLVEVQVNAAAYLAGRHHPVIDGATPPIALDSAAVAVTLIIVGLVVEAVAALIVFIVIAVIRDHVSMLVGRRHARRRAIR